MCPPCYFTDCRLDCNTNNIITYRHSIRTHSRIYLSPALLRLPSYAPLSTTKCCTSIAVDRCVDCRNTDNPGPIRREGRRDYDTIHVSTVAHTFGQTRGCPRSLMGAFGCSQVLSLVHIYVTTKARTPENSKVAAWAYCCPPPVMFQKRGEHMLFTVDVDRKMCCVGYLCLLL